MTTVSGQNLYLWRRKALIEAIAANVSVKEVDWLLQEITALDSLTLRLESFKSYPTIAIDYPLPQLTQMWQKRLKDRVPVQYLVGSTTWRNWHLAVAPGVLIPRPETELIVEIIQKARLPRQSEAHWVDLGTGSGAIALCLATMFPQAQIHAVDISPQALKIARENAKKTGLAANIKFYKGSWFEPLAHLKGKITGIVANPPYIPTEELSRLEPEVSKHEPHLALDGGKDGLDAVRHLITLSPQYLCSQGIWLVEIMAGQASDVVAMLSEQGNYYNIKTICDLSGIERFVLAYRK